MLSTNPCGSKEQTDVSKIPALESMQIKVSIVDDDKDLRASLATLIRDAASLKLVGEYANAEIALQEIPKHPPNVVLMDINMPGMAGIECVRQLKTIVPTVQF